MRISRQDVLRKIFVFFVLSSKIENPILLLSFPKKAEHKCYIEIKVKTFEAESL